MPKVYGTKEIGTLSYDVVVIGAGHAGCEAANASANLGAKTLLLTTSLDTIGWIACSPSFGGPGRGQLLRELDALGGLMPKVIDECAIHFRHSGKNNACWAPFAICDRFDYHCKIKGKLETINNLFIEQDTVNNLFSKKGFWQLITVAGQSFRAKCVIVTAGTFLKGRARQGQSTEKAGRNNEIAADSLAEELSELGFKMGVFRTGTGPSVHIDKDALGVTEKQSFNKKPRLFSFTTEDYGVKQVATYKTHTTVSLVKELRKYSKQNKIKGPRYCPSLIEKAVKFPDKTAHPVFVQPENLEQKEWFLNGFSMDFADDVQQRFVNMVKGLEGAKIIKNGYSVTYNYLKSAQLESNLESKVHCGLFFAGQVIGSSGYEEAASTGLIAGINAALLSRKKKPLVLDRSNSYIGVLIDDLTSKRITEPYRMLTSRVENRLVLRCDNADLRLVPIGYQIGLLNKYALNKVLAKDKVIKKALNNGKVKRGLPADVIREIEIIKKYQPYFEQQKGIVSHETMFKS